MKNSNAMKKLRKAISNGEDIYYPSFVKSEILHEGDELLFLSKVGSQLYGMATENSDLDIRGIFLPSTKSLILQNKRDHYGNYSTNTDDESHNSSEDVDIELWSIHRFFKLLQKGDTNAYDLLFAMSNESAILYKKDIFEYIYDNRDELMGAKPIKKSFIGYAYGQYKRYEAKGFNFQTLKFIMRWFKNNGYDLNAKLEDYATDLIKDLKKDIADKVVVGESITERTRKQLWLVDNEEKDETFLEVNQYKKYPLGIKVKQFLDAIQKWTKEYGSRVKNADGVDYKSISHAFRVLDMALEIAQNGDLQFPLDGTERLLAIKRGEKDYKKLVKELKRYKDYVAVWLDNTYKVRVKPNYDFVREIILYIYSNKGCDFE